jgi:hypothetical protein
MNELEMQQTGTQLIVQSQGLTISNQQGYTNAVEVCKDIKVKIKAVEEYWEKEKSGAYSVWKGLCAKEKQLLESFTKAETDIKSKMVVWQRQLAEEARVLREDQERYRKEEEARLLALAVEAEGEGMEEHSEYLVDQAQVIHTAVFKQPEQTRVTGSAVKTTWKARIVNESIVPIEMNGMVIRPIDTTLLNKLAAGSKGTLKIAGVEFYEDISVSVSRG